jgi:hypothetical protein
VRGPVLTVPVCTRIQVLPKCFRDPQFPNFLRGPTDVDQKSGTHRCPNGDPGMTFDRWPAFAVTPCCVRTTCPSVRKTLPERTKNSSDPVMGFSCPGVCRASRRVIVVDVHAVLLAASQGGRALVAAGEGGEYLHLQTQCRADKRLPHRLVPSIIGGRGPEGPEP